MCHDLDHVAVGPTAGPPVHPDTKDAVVPVEGCGWRRSPLPWLKPSRPARQSPPGREGSCRPLRPEPSRQSAGWIPARTGTTGGADGGSARTRHRWYDGALPCPSLPRRCSFVDQISGRELLGDEAGEAGRVASDKRPAECQALHIAGDVGPPDRVEKELDCLLRPRPRCQSSRRATSSVTASGSALSSYRRKAAFARTAPRASPRPAHGRDHLRVVGDPERRQVLGHDRVRRWAPATSKPRSASPSASRSCGRADEEDRLLPAPVAAEKTHLLARVLGVVTGIGLVCHQGARAVDSTGRSVLIATGSAGPPGSS